MLQIVVRSTITQHFKEDSLVTLTLCRIEQSGAFGVRIPRYALFRCPVALNTPREKLLLAHNTVKIHTCIISREDFNSAAP